MKTPTLVKTIEGNGFPNVYIYAYRGTHFGTSKTWRSSPAGWLVSECDADGNWGAGIEQYSVAQTRRAAIAVAVAEIDWRMRPGVDDTTLNRLIAEEPSR